MYRNVLLCCIFLMFIAVPVIAKDLIATYQYPNGQTITITTRDSKHIRMDSTPDSYMLLNGEKLYTVSEDDGEYNVIDMDQMKGMGGFMSGFMGKKEKDSSYDVKFKSTGKTETIAGYKGKVYTVSFLTDGKIVDSQEIVFCKDKKVQKVHDALMAISFRMGQMAGGEMSRLMEQSNEMAKKNKYGAMIRMGNNMKLQSLTQLSLSSSHYDLPTGAEIIDIKGPMQQIEENKSEESNIQEVLADDAKDIGESAHDEAKNTASDEVKKGVRGLLKGLFKK